ncbi:MAG: hypothetical protein V4590_07800 [Bacteroidota bacterium]
MATAAANTVTRLTALWALSESGLGGLMHALKIPFTGFFLGGFAIVIITLIAFESTKPFKVILQATLLVILVKAAASPHSPPMAYIAVAFQGVIGAVLFSVIPFFRLAACIFGMIALFESAIQKFLVATLIFGKSIWEALDAFVASVLKDLTLFNDFSFSIWLIASYTGVYIIWGGILGLWASGLPKVIHQQSDALLLSYNDLTIKENTTAVTGKRKFGFKLMATFFILLFIVTVFLMQGSAGKIWYVLGRTIAALLILFYIINPLIKTAINRWLKKQQQSKATQLTSILNSIPELRLHIAPAMRLARNQHTGLGVYKAFVTNLIVFALYK